MEPVEYSITSGSVCPEQKQNREVEQKWGLDARFDLGSTYRVIQTWKHVTILRQVWSWQATSMEQAETFSDHLKKWKDLAPDFVNYLTRSDSVPPHHSNGT